MPARNLSPDKCLRINLERNILVDPQDSWLLQWRIWTVDGWGYARVGMSTNVGRIQCYLHHCIISYPLYEVVDHINRNTLDNRRQNLRFVTDRDNRMNSFVGDNPMHHIRVLTNGTYQVRIYLNGAYRYATFDTVEEAMVQRDAWMSNDE